MFRDVADSMSTPTFNPTTDIPPLTNKVIFITGGTAGLGRETTLSLATHNPAHIYFSGRSQDSADKLIAGVRAQNVAPKVPLTFIRIDLASMASIKTGAAEFLARETTLNFVFANAGVMALSPGLTEDGYEVQFGTNHLGHAALVKLLMPTMESTAADSDDGGCQDVRIIWNTSQGYKFAGGIDFDNLKTPQTHLSPIYLLSDWFRYGQSKLAILLYAQEIAKRHPNVLSVAIHPGVAFTGLVTGLGTFNRWFVWATTLSSRMPVEQCAWNQQWAAFASLGSGQRNVVSGCYYEPVGVKGELSKPAADDTLAEELWKWTQRELSGHGV